MKTPHTETQRKYTYTKRKRKEEILKDNYVWKEHYITISQQSTPENSQWKN